MAENAQGKEFNLEDLLKMGKGIFEQVKKETSKNLNVLIAGKTGAGKSTLINALFGKEVAKTSDVPETDRVSEYIYNNFIQICEKNLCKIP